MEYIFLGIAVWDVEINCSKIVRFMDFFYYDVFSIWKVSLTGQVFPTWHKCEKIMTQIFLTVIISNLNFSVLISNCPITLFLERGFTSVLLETLLSHSGNIGAVRLIRNLMIRLEGHLENFYEIKDAYRKHIEWMKSKLWLTYFLRKNYGIDIFRNRCLERWNKLHQNSEI